MVKHDVEKIFEEVNAISFSDLTGLNIFTIGTGFWGLNSREFRKMLAAAGANIDKYPKKSTDIIVVGNKPSKSSILNILVKINVKNRAPFVKEPLFLSDFFQSLRTLSLNMDLHCVNF